MINPIHFGGKVSKKDLAKYKNSKNWKNNKFQNLEHTTMDFSWRTFPSFLKAQMQNRASRKPKSPIPIQSFNTSNFLANAHEPKFIWFGHSVLLIQIEGKSILIVPMFGSNAAPIGPFQIKRFSEKTIQIIDELPPIDAILFTHDHYDHLGFESISKLKNKTNHFFVALGVARHLTSWGIAEHKITELDWHQTAQLDTINLTFTPSRHFTGRGLTDRAKSLWGGWVLKTNDVAICVTGDGGYGNHFKEIGEKYGPFDIAFVECGQYNANWRQIHMHPEDSVQAALDLNANIAVPIHWAGFTLALHHWKEPVYRFTTEAKKKNLNFLTPLLGEIVSLKEKYENAFWYENHE